MFFKHFGSKNQLPGLSIIETLVENGLNKKGSFSEAYSKYNETSKMKFFLKIVNGLAFNYFLKKLHLRGLNEI